MSDHANPLAGSRITLREVALLLIGAAFTSLMFNLPELAVITGSLALATWAVALLRGPRLSWRSTLALGGGLFVTYAWWPAEGWWPAAITLMWAGIFLMAIAIVIAVRERRARPGSRRHASGAAQTSRRVG